jgi:hypothetical protein
MFIPSKAFASSFVLLLYNQPQSRLLYYIFYILCLDLKLNIVIDFRLLYPTDDITADSVKYKTTILGKDNVLAKLIGSTNILNFTRTAHPALPLLLIVLLLLLFLWILFQLFASKKLKAFASHMGESETKISISTRILSVILHYFDIYFLYVCIIFSESITCMKQYSMYQRSSSESTLLYTDNLSLQASEAIQVQRLVCSLNPSISCRGIIHIYILMLSSILLLIGIYLKYISHRLLSHKPNPSFPMSKYGSIDNLHTALILTLLTLKTCMRAFPLGQRISLTFYYLFIMLLEMIDAVIIIVYPPYYSMKCNMHLFSSTMLICILSLGSVVCLQGYFGRQNGQYSLGITLAIVYTAGMRIGQNIHQIVARYYKLDPRNILATKSTLNFVYAGLQYIDARLDNNAHLLQSKEYKDILFYLLCLKEKHEKKINDHNQFLANKEATLENNPYYKVQNLDAYDGLSAQHLLDTFNLNSVKSDRRARIDPSPPQPSVLPPRKPKRSFDKVVRLVSKMSMAKEQPESSHRPGNPKIHHLRNVIFAKSHLLKKTSISKSLKKLQSSIHRSASIIDNMDCSPLSNISNASAIDGPKDRGGKLKSLVSMLSVTPQVSTPIPSPGEVREEEQRLQDAKELLEYVPAKRFEEMVKKAKKISDAKRITDHKIFQGQAVRDMEAKREAYMRRIRARHQSKYALLDMIEEARLVDFRLPIVLVGDILEEVLHELLQSSTARLHEVEEVLNVYVDFKMNYMGNEYQVSLKVREFERRFSKASKRISLARNQVYFDILYKKIELHIKHNLDTGNLIFQHHRQKLTFPHQQQNFMRLYDCAKFINIYGDLKKDIEGICDTKNSFVNGLLLHGADFRDIFRQTTQFSKQQTVIVDKFDKLVGKCEGKFTPLMMIYGNYLYHIEQNLALARKILRQFVIKNFFFDMRNICTISLGRNEEMITIGCSMEKETFHTINMVSCNCFFYLEYDAQDLIGHDLSILIPKPLDGYHRNLMKPANLSGILFERKTYTELSIVKKNGYLAVGQATFRMNYRVDRCLEVFASIIFDKDTYGFKNIMVVNEDMLITAISEAGTDYFEKETFIFQYNKRFNQIFNSMNYFSNFRMKHELSMDTLMEDDHILEHCRVYFNFLNGDKIDIIDKNGMRRPLYMKISVSYMPTVGKYMQFIEFELDIMEDFGATTIGEYELTRSISSFTVGTLGNPKERNFNYSLLDSRELKVKQLLDYLQTCTYLGANTMQSKKDTAAMTIKSYTFAATNLNRDNSLLPREGGEGGQNGQLVTMEVEREFGNLLTLNERRQTVRDTEPPQPKNENKVVISEKIDYTKAIKTIEKKKTEMGYKEAQDEQDHKSDFENLIYARTAGITHDLSARFNFMKPKEKSEDSMRFKSSQLRKVLRRDFIDHKNILVLISKIASLNTNIMVILLASYLAFSLVVQAVCGYYKYPVLAKLGTEVLYKMVALDHNMRELNSTVGIITAVDLNRMVLEGKIRDDLFGEENMTSILSNNERLLSQFISYPSLSYWHSHLITTNLSFPSHLPKQASSQSITVHAYSQEYLSIPSVSLHSAYSYVQPLIDRYCRGGRDLDTAEEVIRLNLGPDLIDSIRKRGDALSVYFHSMGSLALSSILLYQLFSTMSLVLLTLMVLAYTALLKYKFRYVYSLMFEFKVNTGSHREETL